MRCPKCSLGNIPQAVRCVHCGADLSTYLKELRARAQPYDEVADHLAKGRTLKRGIRYYCAFTAPVAVLFGILSVIGEGTGGALAGPGRESEVVFWVWLVSTAFLVLDFSPQHRAYSHLLINFIPVWLIAGLVSVGSLVQIVVLLARWATAAIT